MRVRSGGFGRPPDAALAMFKALLQQHWYGLPDPGREEALPGRVSFRRFGDFTLDADRPDETTLCRFPNALKDAGLGEKLFAEINRQLDARGLIVRQGPLIDAALIESAVRSPPSGSTPRSTPDSKGVDSSNPLDPGACWTRSDVSCKLFFGYEAYPKKERRLALTARGAKDRIQHRLQHRPRLQTRTSPGKTNTDTQYNAR